jgi:predicted nucleotidyltransferase
MAIREDQVDRIVQGFIARLEQEIPVHEVILFGSYAIGKPKEHSDIDLAIISDWFEGKPAIENIKYLARLAARHNTLIEALPFTEKEYKRIDPRTLLSRIVQTGKKYKTMHSILNTTA